MLNENHPLYSAQTLLMMLFEKADPEQFVEFRAIAYNKNAKLSHLKGPLSNACRIRDIEKSFDQADLPKWITQSNDQGYDIYFGVCPRVVLNHGSGGRVLASGGKNVSHAVCAWVDCDKTNWRDIIALYPTLRPTFQVATGRGVHLYFMYEDRVDADLAHRHSEALRPIFSGDTTTDTARILRLPGTSNNKLWPTRRPCELAAIDVDARMDASVIERLEMQLAPKTTASTSATSKDGRDGLMDVPTIMSFLQGLNPDLHYAVRFGHEHAGIYTSGLEDKEGKRSDIDSRVMRALIKAGITNKDTMRLIFSTPEFGISAKALEESKRGNFDNYFNRTWEFSLNKAESDLMRQEEFLTGGLRLSTMDDLNKTLPVKFSIDKLLSVGGTMMISGPAKSYKSFIISDLTMLLAGAPGKFLERFQINCPGPVVYLQAEIYPSNLRWRYNTIAEGRGFDKNKLPHEIRFWHNYLDLVNPGHVNALKAELKKFSPRYLVVDPLARYHHLDENRQGDMSRLLRGISALAAETGISGVILVHHHGKPQDGNEKEGLNSLRGSSVLGDWANAYVIVKKVKDPNTGQKTLKMSFELRDAEEPEPMELKLDKKLMRLLPYSEQDNMEGEVRRILLQCDGSPDADVIATMCATLGLAKNSARKMLAKIRYKDKAPGDVTGSLDDVMGDDDDDD